jgi:hypothetical protein
MSRIATCLVVVCVSTSPPAFAVEFLFGDLTNLGSPLNSSLSEHGSHITADGLSLYVSRGPNFGNNNIYVLRRTSENDPWGPSEILSENVNSSGKDGIPSLTADELSLFYSDQVVYWGAIRPGGFGGGDLWVSRRPSVESPWGESINVGEPVNSQYRESDASVSADGLSLFFTSSRPGGFGNSDIWMSSRTSLQSSWEEPQNLGPLVNSSTVEQTPSISPDGLTLFFGTKREGTQFTDLWAASRDNADSPWESPVNLGPRINTSFVELSPQLSADGSTFYFSRWTNNNEFDIFSIPVLPAESLLGDLNLDGEVNGLDVDPFVDTLLSGPYAAEADMNEDQVVNGLDVDPFVAAVLGGVQQIPEPSTLLLAIVALGVVGGWRKRGG